MPEEMNILIEGSGKHCHLCQDTVDKIFGKGFQFEIKKMLSQPGQFATTSKVKIIGPKGATTMSILGPCRKDDQVELSYTDARAIGLNPPCVMSGELANAQKVTIEGPCGSVEVEHGAIAALRHCHIHTADAEKWGIKNGETVAVKCGGNGPRPIIFYGVAARVSDNFATVVHLDYDELNAAALFEKDPYGVIIKDGSF